MEIVLEAPSPEEMKNKMELETNVMKYALKTRGIELLDWAVKYSSQFRELFENTDIWQRYQEVFDQNPESIYKWIQDSVEKMAEERK